MDWFRTLQLLGLGGDKLADPQQAGPHPALVAVLRAAGAPLLPGQGPPPDHRHVLVTHLLLRLQEVHHALQDLRPLHLRVLEFLEEQQVCDQQQTRLDQQV